MIRKFISRAFLAAAILPLALSLNSCKRGEDDPFLSFRTRDARLMGEWTVASIESKQEINNSVNSSVTNTLVEITYSGADIKLDSTIVTNTTTYKRTYTNKEYSMTLNIMEAGVMEGIEKYGNKTVTGTGITGALETIMTYRSSIKGYWKWATDDKSKSTVTLSTGPVSVAFGGLGVITYQIQKLTNKEVVLIYNDYEKEEESYPGQVVTNEIKRSLKVVLTQGEEK